ncbi:serine/threonine protein kinase [Hyalangium versicolor]|uniref:serine/threonine protein kinase n=1 Tax=Hyalangium versicolor TaxID=2861190 RepID=UPI0035A1CEE3
MTPRISCLRVSSGNLGSDGTRANLLDSATAGRPISTTSPQTAIPFGKYLLIKRLAVGGMAELFLAQEPPKPELVVLKRILPYLSEEPEFLQMFLDEARIAAQMHHPNIVQVYELGKLDNTIFIAMEFVEGVDLRRVMQEESKFGATVPFGVAAAICKQVAAGLDYAHFSKGVDGRPLDLIHRDISPQNVMIAYNGRVKIVDFGIAKAGALVNRSKPGVIKGKFLYLSPEQVAQEKLDHRADIFALGTMMYEITTGKSPFAKPTTEGILYAIRSEDPSPPHLLRDDYPTELSRIVMRCLVKDRSLRYQRSSEVEADLAAFLESGVIRQSTDISEYIARLMGEEEERTVLHIPVAKSAGRKEATQAMSPGLTARPARRPTGEGAAAPPDYSAEPEPPTQMARPREMQARASVPFDEPEEIDETNDFEEEVEERTAVGTVPVGFRPPEPGESTVQERVRARPQSNPSAAPASPRRPTPPIERDTEPRARRPATPQSRRPLTEEEEDDPAQSISLTQPTLNQRARRDSEEDDVDEESGEQMDEQGDEGEPDENSGDISVTPPTTGQRRRFGEPPASQGPVAPSTTGQRRRLVEEEPADSISLTQPTVNQRASRQRKAVKEDEELPPETDSGGVSGLFDDDADPTDGIRPDAEDDESTAGYEAEPEPSMLRSRGLIVAVVAAAVLLLLGLGLLWALSSDSGEPTRPDGPLGPPKSAASSPGPPPPSQAAPVAPTPTPTNGSEALAAAANPNPNPAPESGQQEPSGSGAATPPADSPGGAAGAETAVAAANPADPTPAAGSGGETEPAAQGDKAGAEAAAVAAAPVAAAPAKPGVSVKFKTNSAVIRVDGQKIEPNKVLSFPAGQITVDWSCPPRRRREGSDIKLLKPSLREPYVYEIRCRKNSR